MAYKPERRWLNPHQPQTLQIGVILLYLNAAFFVVFAILERGFNLYGLALAATGTVGAVGIASERRWGYWLGTGTAVVSLGYAVWLSVVSAGGNLVGLIFALALVALLVHPASRDYRRIWFK